MNNDELIIRQHEACKRYGAEHVMSPPHLKVGIARNVRDRIRPINGLRHPAEGDTTRWYLWAGNEIGDDPDFFLPLHVEHLVDWCPEVLRLLGLPPGWRFLIAGEYEDVWQDPSLLF